jgi:putative salt-induced outer membrane protein YdiY
MLRITVRPLIVLVGVAATLLVAPAASVMAQPPAAAPAPPPPDWTGNVSFGLALAKGNNDTLNVNGGYELKFDPKSKNVFKSTGLFLYGESDGVADTEQVVVTARDEYTVHSRVFVYGDFRYMHDKFSGVSYLAAPTGGIGFKLVNLPATTLNVGLGGGGVWEKDYGFAASSSAALTFDEKFTHKVTPAASVGQTFLALWKTNDFEDAIYAFGVSFSAAINKQAQLKVQLLDTYRNQPQDTTKKKNDVSLIVGVVFKF